MDGQPDLSDSGPGPGGTNPDETAEPHRSGVFAKVVAAVRDWWIDLQFMQMWHVVAVIAIVATGAFGGLDAVQQSSPTFKVGEALNNGEFTITVHRASLVRQIVGDGGVIAGEKPGRMYLGVIADITNHVTMPDVASQMFALPDIANASEPTVYRMSDGTQLTLLQPGLTEKVAVAWSVPVAAVTPGRAVSVQVPYRVFSHGFVLYGEGWVDGKKTATTTVQVEVRR